MIFPKPLQQGDCVGLIAPASPVTPEEHAACVKVLEKLEYSVIAGDCLKKNANRYGYLAGDAQARARDINAMFADSRIQAIFCTRGGYGSVELLKYLDYKIIQENPKIFVGYSDITGIHAVLQKKCGFVTFHGPMVKPNLLWEKKKYVWKRKRGLVARIEQALEEDVREQEKREMDLHYMLKSLHAACNIKECGKYVFQNPPGEEMTLLLAGKEQRDFAEGRLFGGNLSVLARLLGTEFSPVGNGEILFLEDIGESLPRIHMLLIHLEYAGMFRGVRGILLGDFTDCTNEKYDNSVKTEDFLKEWFAHLGIPVWKNVCSDHRNPMGTLPLGAWCEVGKIKEAPRCLVEKYSIILE